jgi:hypothetical protein
MPRTSATETSRCRKAARLLALAVSTSSVLFAATAILWARSYVRQDMVIWRRSDGASLIAGASRGRMLFGRSLYPGIDGNRDPGAPRLVASQTSPWPIDARHSLDPCRPPVSWGGPYEPGPWHQTAFDYAGFGYQRGLKHSVDYRRLTHSTVVSSRIVLVPCWAAALAFAVAPGLLVVRRLVQWRRSRGRFGFDVSLGKPNGDGKAKQEDPAIPSSWGVEKGT